MDPQQERESPAEIRLRQQHALGEAARERWPWWYVAGMAALIIGVGAALDTDESATWVAVCVGAFLAVNAWLERRTRVQVDTHGRYTKRTLGLATLLVVGSLAAYTAFRVVVQFVLGPPWPSTIAAVGVAVLFVAVSPIAQRAFYASLRRVDR